MISSESLNFITSAKILFPNKAPSPASGGRAWTDLFGGRVPSPHHSVGAGVLARGSQRPLRASGLTSLLLSLEVCPRWALDQGNDSLASGIWGSRC